MYRYMYTYLLSVGVGNSHRIVPERWGSYRDNWLCNHNSCSLGCLLEGEGRREKGGGRREEGEGREGGREGGRGGGGGGGGGERGEGRGEGEEGREGGKGNVHVLWLTYRFVTAYSNVFHVHVQCIYMLRYMLLYICRRKHERRKQGQKNNN